MATGPYDLGPFQELKAISFPRGGVFGWINGFTIPSTTFAQDNHGFHWNSQPDLSPNVCSLIGNMKGIYDNVVGRSFTRTFCFIGVGSNWLSSYQANFGAESTTSESPGETLSEALNFLAQATVTHVATAENFTIPDISDAIKLCEDASSDGSLLWGTTTGSLTHTAILNPLVSVETENEYWGYKATVAEFGTANERYQATFWKNDRNNSPATDLSRFNTGSINDKITWT